MATSTSKKRKTEEENRSFKIEWEIKYFFVEDSGKYICLICRETIAYVKKRKLGKTLQLQTPVKFCRNSWGSTKD